jgi:hypothetical protein
LSGAAKFKDDMESMANLKLTIESCTRQMLNETSHQQHADIQKIAAQIADLGSPMIRVEQAVSSQSKILGHQMNEEILDWLSMLPYRKHFDVVEKSALPGTGQWLFHDSSFVSWQSSRRSEILWLHGSSGSGKSTLS